MTHEKFGRFLRIFEEVARGGLVDDPAQAVVSLDEPAMTLT